MLKVLLLSLLGLCSATIPQPDICIIHNTIIEGDSVLNCSVIFSVVSISPNETSTVTVNSLFIDPTGMLSMDYNDVIIAKNDVVLGGLLNINVTGYPTNFTIIKSENGTITGRFIPGYNIVYTKDRVILNTDPGSSNQTIIIVVVVVASVCILGIVLGILRMVRKKKTLTANPLNTCI
jgi:hypothetical protein